MNTLMRIVACGLFFVTNLWATGIPARDLPHIPIFKTPLLCTNPGTHQDIAKTPIITNTTGKPIGDRVRIYWKSTDGDRGHIFGPLGINERKLAEGRRGNGYQCEAYIIGVP